MTTKDQAIAAALKAADANGVEMVVTYNPYAETPAGRWGCVPKLPGKTVSCCGQNCDSRGPK